jgi:hypothetical protein
MVPLLISVGMGIEKHLKKNVTMGIPIIMMVVIVHVHGKLMLVPLYSFLYLLVVHILG